MPRNGQGVYSLPPNTAAVAGQTIESAPYNTVNNDIANDLNAARPITAGGTGATNAADALANLGGVGQSNFLAAYPIGDFYETVRNIAAVDGVWLRRNGALYDSSTYPDLAALLPTLPDGVDWSNVSIYPSGASEVIISTPSGFMTMPAVGTTTTVYTSATGASWAAVATITGFTAYDVVYGGGIYVAVDGAGKVSRSNDGITWSAPVAISGFTGLTGVAYGAGLFVAVGDGGKISSSPDGITWTARTSGVTDFLFMVRFVNSVFVAVGQTGKITTSPDGLTWTVRTSGVTNILYDVTYGAGLYVIVGGTGTILTSSNLSAWTPRTSGTTQNLQGIAYSTAGFLAVGSSGVARISSAGTTWTSTSTGVSGALTSVVADPNAPAEYYVVGFSGTSLKGIRTLPTQFRVPSDDPTYGWIKAEDA